MLIWQCIGQPGPGLFRILSGNQPLETFRKVVEAPAATDRRRYALITKESTRTKEYYGLSGPFHA